MCVGCVCVCVYEILLFVRRVLACVLARRRVWMKSSPDVKECCALIGSWPVA